MSLNVKVCMGTIKRDKRLHRQYSPSLFKKTDIIFQILMNANLMLTDARRFVQMSMEVTTVTVILDSPSMTIEKHVQKVCQATFCDTFTY